MFSAIKKVGKLTKKKKKKGRKDKNAEVLESDSESEGEELPEGSGYSGGTLDRSTSETGEIGDSQPENFAQVNFEGDKASVSMCGGEESEEVVPSTPTRARQRRPSAVNMLLGRALLGDPKKQKQVLSLLNDNNHNTSNPQKEPLLWHCRPAHAGQGWVQSHAQGEA